MLGSWCFISPKLHVSKIKALFRLSGKIRAFADDSELQRESLEEKKSPPFSDALSKTGQKLLIMNIWFKLALDFHKPAKAEPTILILGFIACRGSRSMQSGLFSGRWRRRIVSWYGESGLFVWMNWGYFCINPRVLTRAHDLVLLWGLIDQQ